MLFFSILILLSFFSPFRGMAQQARVKLEPDSIMIGQRAKLTIEVDAPRGSIVLPPALSDTLSDKIELLSFGKLDTISSDKETITIRQEMAVTAWSPGFIVIPPLPFIMISASDTIKVDSEPCLLQVQGVDIAENDAPFDIKPIFRMPVSLAEILVWWIPISLFLGLVIGFILWYLKRRKYKPAAESIWEKPEIPAYIAAISSLEGLKNKKLWQNGKVKLYYSELTFILRMYLEKRFGIIALEMTSTEILQVLPLQLKDEELTESLKYILEVADLVKFAKFEPQPQQNDECLEMALDFVKRTIPLPHAGERNKKETVD